MRKTWILIKNYFNCFIGRFTKNKKATKKNLSGIGLVLLFGLIFVFMFISLAISTLDQAMEAGDPRIALYVNASMALVFLILLTITKSTTPSKGKDEELLLSLPVSKKDIVISKVFFDYLFDFFIVIGTLVPSYVVYFIKIDTSFLLVLRSLVVCLLIPMLSSALGYFLSLIFSIFSSKFKYYSIIQSIFTIIFLLVFMVMYYGITMASSSGTTTNLIMSLEPIRWIVMFIENGDLLSLLYIVLCTIPVFVISILIKAKLLGRSFNKYKTKNNGLNYKKSKAFTSLYKREIARYFSLPVYVVNTLFGAILLLLVAFILLFIGKDYIINLLAAAGLKDFEKLFLIAVLLIMLFTISTVCITSSSVSLEGKTLWILKAHPVNTKTILLSKVFSNFIIGFVPIFISSTLIAISIGFKYYVFLLLIPLVFQVVVSIVGLITNLEYPKLEWENEMSVVKQSLSVGIAMGINIVLAVLPLASWFILSGILNEMLVLGIILIEYIIIAFISYKILVKKGIKLFDSLN